MCSCCKVRTTPGFWAVAAVALTGSAGRVLPVVLLAAVCHELGHLAALRLAGGRVEEFRLTAFGARISCDTRYLYYGRELLCVLAGPGVNLLMGVCLARVGAYTAAGAHVLQGCFNLLPAAGLDGGRALHLLVSWLAEPMTADRICRAAGFITAGSFLLAAAVLAVKLRGGNFLLLAAVGLVLHQIPLVKAAGKR